MNMMMEETNPYELRPLRDLPLTGPILRLASPFLPEGEVSLWFGKGGAGKSYLALGVGLSIASGESVLSGVIPTVVGDVAVLDFEAQERQWRNRAEQLAAGAGLELPAGLTYAALHETEIGKFDLRGYLRPAQNLQLVIVDSVEAALGSSMLGSDPSDRVRELWRQARRLGVAVLLIDHQSKTEGVTPSAYGSVFKQNWSRDVWQVDGELGRGEVTLTHVKTNDIAKQLPMAFRAEFNETSVRFEHADAKPKTQADRLVQYLTSAGGVATIDDVMDEFGWSRDNVRKVASRSGRIRTGNGQVQLVTA